MFKITPLVMIASVALSTLAAQAQTTGYSFGRNNNSSGQIGTPFGGGSAFGGGTSSGSGSNSGYVGPTGSYYYPGFGWSSRPMGTQPAYGSQVYGGSVYGAPIYQAPVAVAGGGGFFRIGNLQAQYWQAPSGNYYPWGIGAVSTPSSVYIVNQGVTQPSRPALSSVFSDMEKYLDYSKDRSRVSSVDYDHLFRRMHDLQAKYDNLRSQAGGTLDQADEDMIRRDVDQLSGEIAMRVKSRPQK